MKNGYQICGVKSAGSRVGQLVFHMRYVSKSEGASHQDRVLLNAFENKHQQRTYTIITIQTAVSSCLAFKGLAAKLQDRCQRMNSGLPCFQVLQLVSRFTFLEVS